MVKTGPKTNILERGIDVHAFMQKPLVAQIDREVARQQISRAQFIREACRSYLRLHGSGNG